MNTLLRVLLFLVSTGMLFFVLKKIRNSQVQIDSAIFWILFMLGLVITSVFPDLIFYISTWIGIDSPANFVFLCVIFLLLIKLFNLSLQMSKLQYQIQQLTQIVALEREKQDRDKPVICETKTNKGTSVGKQN